MKPKSTESRISDLLAPAQRYVRSANLERDFEDPEALDGYVFTDFADECLARLAEGLKAKSGHRVWRLTGDYGSGKSSFALFLAHAFSGEKNNVPGRLRKSADVSRFGVSVPKLAPVLVTCSREPFSHSIGKGLARALAEIYGESCKAKAILELRRRAEDPELTDEETLTLIQETNSKLIADEKAKGLLIILDELGKAVEFAALNPQRQDVYLLQRIAEAAERSGEKPLFLVCLLHQAFHAYSDTLNRSAREEWEKVAGRFNEIVFNQPVEQISQIVAAALNVQTGKLPNHIASDLREAMDDTIELGWFGSAGSKSLRELAAALYPIHPTVLPVLIRVFRRFGQNERSLFSFLFSSEPFGLQSFTDRRAARADVFRLCDLFDYVRANLGHRLAAQSYRSRWNTIESLIESFASEDAQTIRVLKAIGILNLLDDGDLIASEASIAVALQDPDAAISKQVRTAITLVRNKRAVWDRGRSRGLCLWPHTSVDLEAAYDKARQAIAASKRVAHLITDYLETRPIVARRHYVETGNLRHFEVRYVAVDELSKGVEQETLEHDGVILVALCETVAERDAALEFSKNTNLAKRHHWLLAVPQPLSHLAKVLQEVQRWDWIALNTPELNGDKFAREEVARQKRTSKAQLERRLQDYIGFKQLAGQTTLTWFQQGERLAIASGRQLLEHLSKTADNAYQLAPRIQSELINRRSPSSAAVTARVKLVGLMFTDAEREYLGLNPDKKPPEMAIYLSVLRNTGLHHESGGKWRLGEPAQKQDAARILPTFQRIREIVRAKPDQRVNVATLFAELQRPPFGVREGLLPLLLAVFAVEHEKEIAFYKDGSFLRELDNEHMMLLPKATERFDLQYCSIEGVRTEVFERLLSVLEIKRADGRSPELLDVVRSLCVFVAQLPQYVRNTKRLSPTALAVRDAILSAREPGPFLFSDLPKACGLPSITPDAAPSKPLLAFVQTLKGALDELRTAFPVLEERIRRALRQSFDLPGSSFQEFRIALAARAEAVSVGVTEAKLRAFCFRLAEENASESAWLESIGSYLGLKPPTKWHDGEEDLFASELATCVALFRRVESIVFAKGVAKGAIALRLAVTQPNGSEHEEIVHYSPDEETRLRELQNHFEAVLAQEERLGLAAASKAIWSSLERKRKK